MRFRPCNLVADAEPAIRKAVERALAQCDIVRPPTPIERLLELRKLTTADRLDLDPSRWFKIKRTAARFWDKLKGRVAGILDLRERHIAVNPSLHRRRRQFLRFHELGHDVLPWHRELFVATSEYDLTPAARERFEVEANCFAGHAIFQNDHMAPGHRGKRLDIAELGGLATLYDASLTATARQYLMVQDLPAGLIEGKPVALDGRRGIQFRVGFANDAFLRQFGDRLLDHGFDSNHPASAVLNHEELETCEVELVVMDRRGEQQVLIADTVFIQYCTLTLLHVKGSKRATLGWRPFRSPERKPDRLV